MNTLISLLGSTLDNHGRGDSRWQVWRPSVALVMQESLHFDRYYLLYQPKYQELYETIANDIRNCSPDTELIGELLPFNDAWDFAEVYAQLYDFSRKHNFAARNDNFYIHITTGTHVAQICLFLLNESHHLPGKLIQTQPHKRVGPAGSYSIIDLDLSQYDLLAQRFEVERRNDLDFLKSGIATCNAKFNSLIETIEQVALRSSEPILISGPTGAGKSQLAKRIYELKKLNHQFKGNFVSVNCATLRGDQAMSTLFGHRRGAFTGAVSDRPRLLKSAEDGMLFLDEIGELNLDEQAMLLLAIEEKKFLPLGADQLQNSDFQLICGTQCDLRLEVAKGKFRRDLLARINLWEFELPGLAERREDIEPNLDYELNRFTAKTGKHISFNQEAKQRFLQFAYHPDTTWQGNFRELNAMVVRLATLSDGGRIDLARVEAEIARSRSHQEKAPGSAPELKIYLGEDYQQRFDLLELTTLQKVIEVCQSSVSQAEAGKKLFAVSRLQKKSANDSDRVSKFLARFGLDFRTIIKLREK